jgi:hypothetical protein
MDKDGLCHVTYFWEKHSLFSIFNMTDKSFRPLQQQQKVPLSPVSAHGNFSKTPEYLTHTRARSHTQGQIRSNLLSNSSSPMLTAVQGFPSNVLSIPLSPTLSARSLGFGQGSSLTNVTTTNDDPLNSAQHELRKKSQAAFNDMSNLFRVSNRKVMINDDD